jgi:allophanate hydrolase subunit 2
MTLVVRKVLGAATVQDLGRVGFASHGVPRGGALVRCLARRANAAVGNRADAACVEIFGRLVIAAERDVRVATEDGAVHALRSGQELVVAPNASLRARYVAIEGGVSAPRILGSRATFIACGIGEMLRAGDDIENGDAVGDGIGIGDGVRDRDGVGIGIGEVAIIAGPDRLDVMDALARTWRISASCDRTGTRLEGAPIARAIPATLPSSPLVVGAIQLPPSGAPIVIGPDGPTTGGYAIVAVIARASLDRFHARPLGASVTFRVV